MDIKVPVFQFEIRYNHILNFSQIARNLLAPYVKLTQSIKIDKQNTVEETYHLNFEEEGYLMIFSWDRAVFRGQGSLDLYTQKNSPVDSLFFDIFQQIYELPEFGEIQRTLFYGIAIQEVIEQDKIFKTFIKKNLNFDPYKIDDEVDDVAIVLEAKSDSKDKSITFGPYWGVNDILKRQIKPINIQLLGDIDFKGVMLEYKRVISESKIAFDKFTEHCTEFNQTVKQIWKIQ